MERDANNNYRKVRIFLASSSELIHDRDAFGNFMMRLQKHYEPRNIIFQLEKWEYADSHFNNRRKQDEYNDIIRQCHIFVVLFYTKAGMYTREELEVAVNECRSRELPIFIYFKDLQGQEEPEDIKKIKDYIHNELKHFPAYYDSDAKLHLDFTLGLDSYLNRGMSTVTIDQGIATLGGINIAEMSQLSFVVNNKDYQRLSRELNVLSEEINKLHQRIKQYPNDYSFRDDLQKAISRHNALNEEFIRYQHALLDTARQIADKRQDESSENLQRAVKAFESGDIAGANVVLNEIAIEADEFFKGFEHDLEQIHQYIESFLLQAKTILAEVNVPIDIRKKQVAATYAKADDWAIRSSYDKKKHAKLLFAYASFLNDYGFYKDAEQKYLRQIKMLEDVYGTNSIVTAISYNQIGMVYYHMSLYDKALDCFLKSISIQKKDLEESYPYTYLTYNNMGTVYMKKSEFNNALKYYLLAFKIVKDIYGEQHIESAMLYNNIGAAYKYMDEYSKAEEFYNKAVEIYKKEFGEEDVNTATSYNNLAGVYDKMGQFDKSLLFLFRALHILEKVLGGDHLTIAMLYNNIGAVYFRLDEYDQALEYYLKGATIKEIVLGINSPSLVNTYENITMVYCKLNDIEKAKEYFLKAKMCKEGN